MPDSERKVTWAALGSPSEPGEHTVPGFDGPIDVSTGIFDDVQQLITTYGGDASLIDVELIRFEKPYVWWNIIVVSFNKEARVRAEAGNRGEFAPGYGLAPESPILCGGGAAGEEAYLRRLRCPSGSSIQFTRRTSVPTMALYARMPEVRFNPGSTPGALGKSAEDFLMCALDIYSLECGCGHHRINELYMDMYHEGPTLSVGVIGWTLAQ